MYFNGNYMTAFGDFTDEVILEKIDFFYVDGTTKYDRFVTQDDKAYTPSEVIKLMSEGVVVVGRFIDGEQVRGVAIAELSDDTLMFGNSRMELHTEDDGTEIWYRYVESAAITVDSELSATSENPVQNKVVTTNFNAAMKTLQDNVLPNLLPTVAAADNGKVLQVVDGAWAAVKLSAAEDMSF